MTFYIMSFKTATNRNENIFKGKCYFHIGYPKTASTTLQKQVFARLDCITYLGKWYDGKTIDFVSEKIESFFN